METPVDDTIDLPVLIRVPDLDAAPADAPAGSGWRNGGRYLRVRWREWLTTLIVAVIAMGMLGLAYIIVHGMGSSSTPIDQPPSALPDSESPPPKAEQPTPQKPKSPGKQDKKKATPTKQPAPQPTKPGSNAKPPYPRKEVARKQVAPKAPSPEAKPSWRVAKKRPHNTPDKAPKKAPEKAIPKAPPPREPQLDAYPPAGSRFRDVTDSPAGGARTEFTYPRTDTPTSRFPGERTAADEPVYRTGMGGSSRFGETNQRLPGSSRPGCARLHGTIEPLPDRSRYERTRSSIY